MSKGIQLTEDQKKMALERGATTDLNELTRLLFNDKSLDGRNKEGIALRKFLAKNGVVYKTTKPVKNTLRLDETQKEYIQTNMDRMTPHQMATALFDYVPHITPFHKEFVIVNRYFERLKLVRSEGAEDIDGEAYVYSYIKTVKEAVNKIHNVLGKEVFNLKELKRGQEELLEKFIFYMNATRLKMLMESFASEADRELFEHTYIEHIWDKADLNTEDISMFLNVSLNYINQKNIQRHINLLNRQLEEDGATKALSDTLTSKTNELNQCETRIKSALQSLNTKRDLRLKNLKEQVMNPLSFVQAFAEKKERARMIQIANYQRMLAEEEADRMESVSEWKARIAGVSKREVI